MSKAPKHASILGDLSLDEVSPAQAADTGRVEKVTSNKPAKGEAALFRTTIIMNRKVHDVLREIAYTERTSITSLIMEGLDSVLKSRRHPSVSELTDKT